MKKTITLLLFVTMITLATALAAAEQTQVVKSTTTTYEPTTNPALCWLRGLSNVAMCWTEIPRCMVYDNAKIPVLGLGAGVVEGAFLTVFRALGGVFDIASFGCSGESIYTSRFPEYFWQSKWVPQKDTITVIKEVPQTPAAAPVPVKTEKTTTQTVKSAPVVE